MRIRLSFGMAALLLFALLLPPPLVQTAGAAPKPSAPGLKLRVGEAAPGFTLKDQFGKDVSLRDFRGKKSVVLAFYIFAFTGG